MRKEESEAYEKQKTENNVILNQAFQAKLH